MGEALDKKLLVDELGGGKRFALAEDGGGESG